MLSEPRRMSMEQVSSFDVGHMVNQQNNKNHQMKLYLERHMSMTYTTNIMNQCNSQYTAPSPTPSSSSSMYWNPEDSNTNAQQQQQQQQHRRLDRSQSEPCNRTSPNVNSSRYKTELCRPFEEKGYCKYSDKCQFAHGENELKTIMRHPKYKTDLCHKYHTDGFCGYGTRCNFIHNENELQLGRIATNNKHALVQKPRPDVGPQQSQRRLVADPGPIQRPMSIMFHNPSVRPASSLSSDSSPVSARNSPSLSPTFFDSEDIFTAPPTYPHRYNNNNSPSFSAISDNVSQLAEISQLAAGFTNLLAPLYVHTTHSNRSEVPTSNISHLNAQLNNQYNNDQHLNDLVSDIVSPHSPPDSISGDSLASSGSSGSLDFTGVACPSPDHFKGLRLPVFAQLGPQGALTAANF